MKSSCNLRSDRRIDSGVMVVGFSFFSFGILTPPWMINTVNHAVTHHSALREGVGGMVSGIKKVHRQIRGRFRGLFFSLRSMNLPSI